MITFLWWADLTFTANRVWLQYSAVQYSAGTGSTVQSNLVQCSTVQCSAVQCNAVQSSALQWTKVLRSEVQCSALHCSPVVLLETISQRVAAPIPGLQISHWAPFNIQASPLASIYCNLLYCTILYCPVPCSTVLYNIQGSPLANSTVPCYIVQYIILNNGILKVNSTELPSSEGYISQYTPEGEYGHIVLLPRNRHEPILIFTYCP